MSEEANESSVTLRVTDTVTYVIGKMNKDLYKEFKKTLGYKDPNAVWRGKKSANWDGYITTVCYSKTHCRCAIKKDGVHFPTGVYSRALDFFRAYAVPVKTIDDRVVVKTNVLDIKTSNDFSARLYQAETINKAVKQQRGIIRAATGSGKTAMGAGIISALSISPFIFYVTSQDLLNQAKEEFEKFLTMNGKPLEVGVIGGGKCDIRDINIMTVQTAVRALGEKYQKFDDEDEAEDASLKDKYDIIANLIHEAKGIIADECVAGDSLVTIRNFGQKRMDELKNFVGQDILSFDGSNVVWKKITHYFDQGKKEVFKIELESGEFIECTGNHPIMTQDGWKEASNLILTDKILYCANVNVEDLQANYVDIKTISKNGIKNVYDITVEDTHCFFSNNILVHNCHHWASTTCQIISDHSYNARFKYAMSATPFRDMGDDLLIDACFGKVISDINASFLIREKILVKPTIYFVHTKKKQIDEDESDYPTIYKECIVLNEERNLIIANLTQSFMKEGRQILILIKNIEHGELLQSLIPGSVFISGRDGGKKRKAHLEDMRLKKNQVCIASSIFDEGVDVKALDTLILAGSGKSQTRALQRIGRVIRSYQDPVTGVVKKDAYVVDFHDNVKYLLSHSKARRRIYETEPEFVIKDFKGNM